MMKYTLRKALLSLLFLVCNVACAGQFDLHYARPAPDTAEGWEREALPIGNGRLGAMLFGGVSRERIQFNEITLWTGDAKTMGAYQAFGDVRIELEGQDGAVSGYRRELNLDDAEQLISYVSGGVSYRREAFASHPDQVIVLRLSASQKGPTPAVSCSATCTRPPSRQRARASKRAARCPMACVMPVCSMRAAKVASRKQKAARSSSRIATR